MWLRFGVGDHLAALSSVFALLLALYRRGKTGEGRSVSSSLLGAMLMTESEALGTPGGSVTSIAHLDANQTGLSRTHRLYRCSDGWLAVAARSPVEKTAFDELAGADPERFLGERGVTRSLAALDAAGGAAAPVLQDQLNAFLDDPANPKAGVPSQYHH